MMRTLPIVACCLLVLLALSVDGRSQPTEPLGQETVEVRPPRNEPFGQETVEVRPPRNPKANPTAHTHQHGKAGHHHGHKGHSHKGHIHKRHSRKGHDHKGQPPGAHDHSHRDGGEDHSHQHDLESENLFGVTLGSDTEHAGVLGVALEAVGRFGKRDGSYTGIGQKLELSYGVADGLSIALGLFGDYHRIAGVTGFDSAQVFDFNGIGGEMRWRLVKREPHAFGVTLHIEPSIQRYDELTGQRAIKYGSENKLIFDTEVVKDRIFAAFNLLHEMERVREHGSADWERSSKVGIAAAATMQIASRAFLGAEIRYLRAYDGLLPQTFRGDATFVGPTLFWHFAKNAWIAAAWNAQIAGHEVGNPARLDLVNFERHQVRLKIGIEFEPASTSRTQRRSP
ncbi:MAG: hypothetical protein ACRECO_02555 [Xanthobacteraceae bacterium]